MKDFICDDLNFSSNMSINKLKFKVLLGYIPN